MKHSSQAETLFRAGCSCSQAVLAAFGQDYGLTSHMSCSLGSGFGGGMAMGETCGAVTGAFMVLGLHHGKADCDKAAGRAAVKAAVLEFTEKFKARRHTVKCRDLLGCDLSTPEGMAQARERGLFTQLCPGLMRDAGEILDDMLADSREQAQPA